MPDSLTIDGFGPLPVRRPASVAEFGELIRESAAAGQGLYPLGGGTALDIGLPPTKPGIVADTRDLADVIDYPARDMTITVRAGITVGAVQATLAKEGQRVPVDVPNPGTATIGGALAANLSGPRRLGYGTSRDYVIGISFLTDAGTEVKGGGRVVKNVAGYDLMKLQIGALGTLGVITQVTLKVTPLPEDQALVAFAVSAAAVGPTLDRLHESAGRPVAVELLNAAAARAAGFDSPEAGPWVVAVGFEEKRLTVDWQLEKLREELKTAPVREIVARRGPECDPVWDALTRLQSLPGSKLSWKANVPPSRMARLAVTAAEAHPDAVIHAHAGSGIVFGHLPSEELTVERASALLAGLAPHTADANANFTVRRCPPDWKRVLPVWGRDTGDRRLMRTVKRTLDPQDVFNPGRLFVSDPV